MDFQARLEALRLKNRDALSWEPMLFQLSSASDQEALGWLMNEGAVVSCVDTIDEQVRDLIRSEQPALLRSDEEMDQLAVRRLGSQPFAYGTWVYYPWSGSLVHTLGRDEFRFLRGDRNRHKICAAEEKRLRACRIGIVGLSVGQAVALTMTLEGVGGSFHLADFDVVDLSNLNRLRVGLDGLGRNKTVMAARAMFEIDPYLEIRIYPDGLSDENIDGFLDGGGAPLDLVVEECDDLYMKVRVREEARRRRIPVVMETNDRGLLDVERFDREPDRPILHGLLGDLQAATLSGLSPKEKVPYMLRIADDERISTAMAASLVELKESIWTWPQLASSVALGGALVTDAARRILLGQFNESGRYYTDIAEIVTDGQGVHLPAFGSLVPVPSAESRLPPVPIANPPAPALAGSVAPVSVEEIRYLVGHALLAPSAGNMQPWRFVFDGRRLHARLREGHRRTFGDFEGAATHAAFGAALENLTLAASAIGLQPIFRQFPDDTAPDLVCSIAFERLKGPIPDRLFAEIPVRVTNRNFGERRPIGEANLAALHAAAAERGARLQIITEGWALEAGGRMLGEADRLQLLCRDLHADLVEELRWTPEEAAKTRDGIEVATLGFSTTDTAALRVCRAWPVMEYLRGMGGGGAFENRARASMAQASGLALLSMPGTGRSSYLDGGRAFQRVWLAATAAQLAIHPWSALVYLFARLLRGGGAGYGELEQASLNALRRKYNELFEVKSEYTEVLLFRIGHAARPPYRAMRRRLSDVLEESR